MAQERRGIILQGLTIKVARVVNAKSIAIREKSVKTPYDASLDDLLDDPDFTEVMFRLKSMINLGI